MLSSVTRWLGLVSATASLAVAAAGDDVIQKDVVIIGGGASGAYAAVRLRDDYNKTIAVIEKESIMGGHVDTYDDPETGAHYNYGVQAFVDMGNSREFFERFGIDVSSPNRTPLTTRYMDFNTGEVLDFNPPPISAQLEALEKFVAAAEKYEHMLHPSYYEFPDGKDIPEDLLMPFHEFVKKYDFEDALPLIWRTTGHGAGDMMNQLTMWVLQVFGAPLARTFLDQQESYVPASGRYQDLYDAIQEHLGDDVFLDSTVMSARRTPQNVSLIVKNSKTGKATQIAARRLLITIQPTADNMGPFHPSEEETRVFSKIDYLHIYAGLVTNDALPVNYSLYNLPATAEPDRLDILPTPPFVPRFDYFGQNYFRFMFIGKEDTDKEMAKDIMQHYFGALVGGGAIDEPTESDKLKFVAMADHGLMGDTVSAQDLKDGWIHDLYALQGQQATWFSGAAFSAAFQTTLWAFDDILLPKLIDDMEGRKSDILWVGES